MSNITDIVPQPDHVGDTCALIDRELSAACDAIAGALTRSLSAVNHNDNHTPDEFWSRLDKKGVSIAQALAAFKAILTTYAPELITPAIATAGQGLTPHGDGTVTKA